MHQRARDTVAALTALLLPPLVGLSAAFVSGRGARVSWWVLLPLGLVPALAAFGRLLARRRALAVVVALELLALAAFLTSFTTLTGGVAPALARYDHRLPPASPPAGMSVHSIVTGVIHRTAAFAYRGGAFDDPRVFTMNAVLVRHPRGDLLVDTGLGVDVAAQLQQMPWAFRAITRVERRASVRQALRAAGYDLGKLRAILLTHAHWDHVSGAGELPKVPVWLPAAERDFMRAGWITAVARTVDEARLHPYAFDDGPYLHFDRSRDVHGDGSVVIVPVPGHTPGSVTVFINLPSGRRFALIGDLAWQREGVLRRSERPLMTRLGDAAPDAVRAELARMAALHARYPEVELVPAHDPRGYVHIPELARDRGSAAQEKMVQQP